jgi:multiple sugar transport system substrate-binding protein
MPRVPQETQFETLLGKDVVGWLAATATGQQPDAAQISAGLKAAAGKVSAGG